MLLADLEQISAVAVRADPGEQAPGDHCHPERAECLIVLEGDLALRIEDRTIEAAPGSCVFVPAEVPHWVAADNGMPARFVEIHVPSRSSDAAVVHNRAGGGEAITDRPERRVRLLVDDEAITTTASLYGPGEKGPDPHVHHHHVDGFVVVEGEITFGLEDRSVRASAGTFVLVPPDVVHSFRNEGPQTARYFNLHAPSFGFGEYLRGRNPSFDQHDQTDGGADPASVIVVPLP